MYDVICIGSATVDAFAYTKKTETISVRNISHKDNFIAYPIGSKILMDKLYFFVGGGGTNTAVALSRLGLRSAYLGNIGKDMNADMILKLLKKEKVNFVGTRSQHMTNYSVVLDSFEDDRTILVYKDASKHLRYEKLTKKKLNTRWFYFASTVGTSFQTQKRLVDFAKKNNIKIAFNPSNYEAEKGPKFLEKILKNTELLILNKEEAALLVGEHTPKNTIRQLQELGPRKVIITNGNNQFYAADDKSLYAVNPLYVKVTESTGAGDAFASSFLGSLIKGKNIEYSLRVGVANAQSVVRHFGAKNKLLSWPEVRKEVKKRYITIKKSKL